MHARQAESTELVKSAGFSKGNDLRIFRLQRGICFSWRRQSRLSSFNHKTLQRADHRHELTSYLSILWRAYMFRQPVLLLVALVALISPPAHSQSPSGM